MVAQTHTVAFQGVEAVDVICEVHMTTGQFSFTIVGLPDKAVAESRERVRGALNSMGLSLPASHIIVNLAPADTLKEGTHYDLPIAVAMMVAMGIVPPNAVRNYVFMGEMGLDGTLRPVAGILPGSFAALQSGRGMICPAEQGKEARWGAGDNVIAPHRLIDLMMHLKGEQVLLPPEQQAFSQRPFPLDYADVKGHESAKRILEIAAVGGHNVLMIGPPGSGKSMLASRLPSILPPMSIAETLDVSRIHSLAGLLQDGCLVEQRPFRDPHHSASMPSLVGGGAKAKPGEISLAHNGVLFLDELPEFRREVLESLRQPLETGYVSVSRVQAHFVYPARFQLIAAMNPCRCGYCGEKGHECARAPRCAQEYQAKISGPFMDRIDLHLHVPSIKPWEMASLSSESSEVMRTRVEQALAFAGERFKGLKATKNAALSGTELDQVAHLTSEAQEILVKAAQKFDLSSRGFHRMIRVARSIADLDMQGDILPRHITEALAYKRLGCA